MRVDVAGQLTDEEEGRKEVPNREALKERHGYLSQEAVIEVGFMPMLSD